jgi:transposase
MFNERGQVHMIEQEEGLGSRLVVGRKRDGRRKYDEAAKRELIQACLRPGVSVTRTAMQHGINPNLVRTWISQFQRERARAEGGGPVPEAAGEAKTGISLAPLPQDAAFMQVATAVTPLVPVKPATTFLLKVSLANGVCLELGEASLEQLTGIVQLLGRLPCSGSTKG